MIAKAEWLPGQPVGNADGEPAGKADGGPAGKADGGPAGKADGEPAGKADGEPAGKADGEPAGKADGEPAGKADGEPAGNADGEPAGKADGGPAGNADGEPAGKADGGPEAGAEGPCATVGEARYNSRFVVTSLQHPDAPTVYEEMYCDRGEAENWIKEQKNDLFLDRCSSSLWNVNALRLRMSALAHALHCMMKHRLENLPVSSMLRRSRPSTLRKCLFRIPVRVTVSTRRIHLAFGSTFPYWKDFRLIWASLAPT